MTTQTQQIADHLRSGKPLTSLQALSLYGCFRAAARIEELRDSGMNIITTMIAVQGAHGPARVAEYRLGGIP